jgi:hypothetical protein
VVVAVFVTDDEQRVWVHSLDPDVVQLNASFRGNHSVSPKNIHIHGDPIVADSDGYALSLDVCAVTDDPKRRVGVIVFDFAAVSPVVTGCRGISARQKTDRYHRQPKDGGTDNVSHRVPPCLVVA